jgi:hypothetical protein
MQPRNYRRNVRLVLTAALMAKFAAEVTELIIPVR